MLHSLTRRLGLENDVSVGVALSRSSLCAITVSRAEQHPRILWVKQLETHQPLFAPQSGQAAGDLLHQPLSQIINSIDDITCPIHVVMPDMVIRAATFELDELPKSKSTLASLASWRISNELGRSEDELICQMMTMGNDRGKHLLYVQGADRYWLDYVKSAFNACGIIPWSINSASYFRHNHLSTMGIKPSSAMLSIDDDCWTLQVWDSDSRIRLTITRLRKSPQTGFDIDAIFNEFTRVLRAWLVNYPDFKLNTLYLDGNNENMAATIGRAQLESFTEVVVMGNIINNPAFNRDDKSSLLSLATLAAVAQ